MSLTDEEPDSSPAIASKSGTHLSDFLPIPSSTSPVTNPDQHETATSIAQEPTLSHALAMDDQEEKGLAQQERHTEDVANLGWNKRKEAIPTPLVGGMDNEELWLLVRRFNKQMYHVREITTDVPGNLDLNIAYDEEFSPDKLRANIERLYMTVIIGVLSMVKHIARLRSWREARRTSAFCVAYFTAWLLDTITPLLLTTLIALVVYPRARDLLFPPAPLALVDSSSGGVQKPKAGVLGSTDSATGAAENHKGEAVEAEASNFFNGVTSICMASATGKHPQSAEADDNGPGDTVPDPSGISTSISESKAAAGGDASPGHDKTKVPMENAMWNQMRPIMHGIEDVSDSWERFANALSPTPPFPNDVARLRLAAIVVPLLAVSLFTTSYMFTKAVTFGIGFGFFGDPVIRRGVALLNRKFPHWQKILEIRNTMLKGVPTNAQLTLTLLRIGEVNKAPLPPPPRINEAPPDRPVELTDDELRATWAEPPLNATDAELEAAMEHDPAVAHETAGHDIDAAKGKQNGRRGSKLVSFFKATTKNVVRTAIGADSVRARIGSHAAKTRLGALPPANLVPTSGPVDFKARYGGKKGHVYISTRGATTHEGGGGPTLAFSTDSSIETLGTAGRESEAMQGDLKHPLWSVPIGEIRELRKVGGYGWKFKALVGWSLGREVLDGLHVADRTGATWRLHALPLRDELFNRLVAMGGQKWEAW